MKKLRALKYEITTKNISDKDYISLTDMIRAKGGKSVLLDWLRNRNTIELNKSEWTLKRMLTKINYDIHKDAIKNKLIQNTSLKNK